MQRLIAKLIGPVLAMLPILVVCDFVGGANKQLLYVLFVGIWCFGVGYIDGINRDWKESL